MIEETSKEAIDLQIQKAAEAFQFLKKTTVKERAVFMNAVADKIEALGEELLAVAHEETSLPLARLSGEKIRTVGQWRSYAKAVSTGIYTEARIDLAQPDTLKSDLRKYNTGIGPVVVFGASNFPLAFSTAGGDTASAIGAGCPVIVKAHPAHPKTSKIMADTIAAAVEESGWPEGVFSHITGTSHETGTYLVTHKDIKGVAFTGSFQGGKALFDQANQREEPIPVFAEMGSINPVFAFQHALESRAEALAREYAVSLTLGVGQFCTNPGVFVALKSESLNRFITTLKNEIHSVKPVSMLHYGIFENFEKRKELTVNYPGVYRIAEADTEAAEWQGRAMVAETTGRNFIENSILSEEVFGPFGMIVQCETAEEMVQIAKSLKGQLTVTVAALHEDIYENMDLISQLKDKCGRFLFNGMPTGVEVVHAMQHGGPFPSTTDVRFTSVGPDAVKRFVRPVSFQNWPDEFLPDELKNSNPLQISRIVNGELISGPIKL